MVAVYGKVIKPHTLTIAWAESSIITNEYREFWETFSVVIPHQESKGRAFFRRLLDAKSNKATVRGFGPVVAVSIEEKY